MIRILISVQHEVGSPKRAFFTYPSNITFERMFMIQKTMTTPVAPKPLQQRIQCINRRLKNEEDLEERRKLQEQRAKLQEEKRNKKRMPCGNNGARLTVRIERIQGKLSKNQDLPVEERERLEHRLNVLKEKKQMKGAVPNKQLQNRVNRIQARLVKNEQQRKKLQDQLSMMENKLEDDDKSQQQKKNPTQQRINRIQARLTNDDTLTEDKRQQFQERLVFLQTKQLENPRGNSNTRVLTLQQRLKRQETLLQTKNLNPVRRQNVERRISVLRAKLQNRNNNKREMNKKRLMSMEQRAVGNEAVLDRIALQQVYVAHYPERDEHGQALKYIPVFSNHVKQKAAIRAQALELARKDPGVDWIGAEQYERLPEYWTLEDEIAMFGGKKGKMKKPASQPGEDDIKEVTSGMETNWVAIDDPSNNGM